jgi:endonuclease/exonuclease/phosphatase family metal-dependent hydrolase
MPTLRLASLNCEWMNDWFTPDADPVAFRQTFTRDGHTSNTTETAARTAALIRAVDPDFLAIQEGPSRPAELDLFVRQYLSEGDAPQYEFFLGDSGGAQKLGLLYKPQSVDSASLVPHAQAAMVLDAWLSDVDGDAFLEDYRFTRNPLLVDVTLGGNLLRIIVMHTKSSFVNKGRSMWENPNTRQNYVVEALKNRRRNSAEGMRLRKYVDSLLDQNLESRIVITGDLNDGPGLDYFEENYLTHNVTDILVGSAFKPEQLFSHAQHDVSQAERYTAVFYDFVGERDEHSLLDHMLLSPGLLSGIGLRKVAGSGRIHHAEYNAQVVNDGKNREDRPSDHRPVSVELEY